MLTVMETVFLEEIFYSKLRYTRNTTKSPENRLQWLQSLKGSEKEPILI